MEAEGLRVRVLNSNAVEASREFILYWMVANRRVKSNFSLQRAVEWSIGLRKPLLIFEPLRCNYRWASDRLHAFVIEGMANNQAACSSRGVQYFPYIETSAHEGAGLLQALAERACVVVTDDFPCFFLPSMLRLVSRKIDIRLETVDSNGVLPMQATETVFPTAYAFRRYLQKELPGHLPHAPEEDPLAELTQTAKSISLDEIHRRWPAANLKGKESELTKLDQLPIDHSVQPATFRGGFMAAEETLQRFLDKRLDRYAESRNDPEQEAASGLSPYLHFGHISTHQVFAQICKRESWDLTRLSAKTSGSREGWWGMSTNAESFLDELITWRELGFNFCSHRADYDRYESLPPWAQKTLADHETDARAVVYSLEQLESATTHDEIWNAAQRQLVREGRMHNYLRMLWGKKILEWAASPREALSFMVELNNKFAVDGRDPNSYSGIFWVLGRYDRAWGPERPIFGKIRYMSSDNTARKLDLKGYLRRYSNAATAKPQSQKQLF
jgi:deoxyribodipyrimidine photo-lyase